MASLFKSKTTVYLLNGSTRDAAGRRVNKDTPGAVKEVRESKKWYARYRVGSKEVTKPLSVNKTVAERILAKLQVDAELHAHGLVSPHAKHLQTPLLEHLDDWQTTLLGEGRTRKHVYLVHARARKVLGGCGFKMFADLDPVRLSKWLAAERAASRLTLTTSNYYLRDLGIFLNWCKKNGRFPANPVEHVQPVNAALEDHRERRILSDEEFGELVRAARTHGFVIRRLSGPDRAMLYLVAAHTGLRAQELSSLTPESFDLAAREVVVDAERSKHRREDRQPIREDLAAALRDWLKRKEAGEPVWPGRWWEKGAELIRADLALIDVPYRDRDGKVFDFHSLRSMYITAVEGSGATPKTLQTLARHSDPKLSLTRYAKRQEDAKRAEKTAVALQGLPAVSYAVSPETRTKRGPRMTPPESLGA